MISSGTLIGCLVCAVWGAAEGDSEPAGCGTVKQHYSFEPDDDLDYDGLPDDWTRRKGPSFPRYVKVSIDCATGSDGVQSLRIDANGGAAILYSPLIPVDALHTYRFQGKIRTANLKQDAAVFSVSLLNHRRQRVQRFLTHAVTGSHDAWQAIDLTNIVPNDSVRFISIGCHLLPGDEPGIGGAIWFDDLTLMQSPRLEIDNGFFSHFQKEDAPVTFTAKVSGLEPGSRYALQFEFFDADGKLLQVKNEPLVASDSQEEEPRLGEPQNIRWNLGQQTPGYYHLTARLLREDQLVLAETTSLAVMRLVDKPWLRGEFGWTISKPPQHIASENLVKIAAQAGINWIKFPIWSGIQAEDRGYANGDLAKFFDLLDDDHIQVIGMLSDPPEDLRGKFDRNWLGVSEIFSTQNSVWTPSVEPVVARYSSAVRHWQLGDEHDSSFEGLSDLAGTLDRAYEEINRIGLNSQLGVPWQRDRPLPEVSRTALGFVSLRGTATSPLTSPDAGIPSGEPPATAAPTVDDLRKAWQVPGGAPLARWALLQPDSLPRDPQQRTSQLARQMLAAKMARLDAVFINQVFEGQSGLLNSDGSPSDLFLPWRTMALAMQDAEFLGEITFPQGSRNAVFVRGNDATIILWTDQTEDQIEEFYLGENVVEMDLLGRTKPLPIAPETKTQTIRVTNTPKILRGCSKEVAAWRLATEFEIGKIRSEYGSHEDAIRGRNAFSSGISGQVTLETPSQGSRKHVLSEVDLDLHESGSHWQAEPREWMLAAGAGEPFRLPVFLTLPSDANLGDTQMKLTFQITADRPYQFQVLCPYRVGSGDVSLQVKDRELPDGRLEIEQIVRNSTTPTEVLDFRCNLLIPGSARQKARVTRLGAGEDRKFYYLENAEMFRGKELRLKLEQEGGGRILNYRWTIGTDWETDQDRTAEPKTLESVSR